MIIVCTPPKVGLDQYGGWELMFWASKAFDYTISFCAILAEMADMLGRHAGAELRLPDY